ncbi:MAG TPA: hypothetical protein VFR19_15975 [Hyphomicrobiaceae bacterium]|jgi:hypothetical protein|nr:hypothetical protein [Hyphomicrobiaceae bacterium]
MDQRPRSELAKGDYIDRYHDSRGSGITALLLGFAALLIAGWLLLSMRVDEAHMNTAQNAPTAIGPAYRAPAASDTHTAPQPPAVSKP